MRKRILSVLFALALCLGLLPVTALANGVTEPIPEGLEISGTIVEKYWKCQEMCSREIPKI